MGAESEKCYTAPCARSTSAINLLRLSGEWSDATICENGQDFANDIIELVRNSACATPIQTTRMISEHFNFNWNTA